MRPLLAAALAGVLATSACGPPSAHLMKGPIPLAPTVRVEAVPVPMDPSAAGRERVGDFQYAGGVALSADDTARLHGLSDLAVDADGRLLSVTDEGDLIEARIVLSPQGRLIGLTDARISALQSEDGRPLPNKGEGDAEGVAVLGDGSRLVSFERHHRIWHYAAQGTAARRAPMPQAQFPVNGGMEALSPAPDVGSDAYLVGAEETGATWICRLSADCQSGPVVAMPAGFGLVAATRLPEGRTAWLTRAWDPILGSRISLRIVDAGGEVARLDLARPLTVDNFEGLAAVPNRDRSVRFYLVSDDNFASSQRTLLLAFDWAPKP